MEQDPQSPGIDPDFLKQFQALAASMGPSVADVGRGVHPYRFPSSMQLKSALAAVKAGADPTAVRQRLMQNGIDPRGI